MAFQTFYVKPPTYIDLEQRVFQMNAPEGSHNAAMIEQALNFLDYFGWEELDQDGNYQGHDEDKLFERDPR